jgi:hypothetical protein
LRQPIFPIGPAIVIVLIINPIATIDDFGLVGVMRARVEHTVEDVHSAIPSNYIGKCHSLAIHNEI